MKLALRNKSDLLAKLASTRNFKNRANLPMQTMRHLLSAVLATLLIASYAPLAQCADSPSSLTKDAADELIQGDKLSRSFNTSRGEQLALEDSTRIRARDINIRNLDIVDVQGTSEGSLKLSKYPSFTSKIGDRYASITPRNNVVFYTLDPKLQDFVANTVARADANHVAVVAMDPKTGAILAIAGRSASIPGIEYHSGFPAASLFKVVTAAAAVEEAGINSDSLVQFRGGTYTLNQWNYLPNPRADRRFMSIGEAMGRSCNPVFGQIGLKYLNGSILVKYAEKFGFNKSLGLDVPLPRSTARIPHNDSFEFSRTSAGFGEVTLSPIHAAALISGVGNNGLLPRPYLIDRVADSDGITLEKTQPETIQRIVQPETSKTLLEMMRYTTTIGTSRREFMRGGRPALGDIEVAGKTGTLSGSNPQGLNNWFIGTAPMDNPELAVAVITVDATHSSKASRLGRLVMQNYFNIDSGPDLPQPRRTNHYQKKSKHKRIVKSSHYRSKSFKATKTKSSVKAKPMKNKGYAKKGSVKSKKNNIKESNKTSR